MAGCEPARVWMLSFSEHTGLCVSAHRGRGCSSCLHTSVSSGARLWDPNAQGESHVLALAARGVLWLGEVGGAVQRGWGLAEAVCGHQGGRNPTVVSPTASRDDE